MENREGLDALLGDDPDPTRQYREAYRQQPTLKERLETARATPAAAAPAWLSNTSQTPTNRIDSNDPYKYDALQTHDPVHHGEQALLAPTISYEDAIGLGIPSLVGKAVTAGAAKLGAAGFMGGAGIFHLHPNPAAAARMEAQGASKEEIWKEMQAYKDKGGNWLGETDDSQAVFTPGKFKDQEWGLGKLLDSARKSNRHPIDTTVGGLDITLDAAGKAHPYPTNYLPNNHPLNLSGTTGDLLSHPELYNKLPDYSLEHTPVMVHGGPLPVGESPGGSYGASDNLITIYGNPFGLAAKKKVDPQKFSAWMRGNDDAFANNEGRRVPTVEESALLHEMQHAIQHKEGRGTGASPDEHVADIPKRYRKQWEQFITAPNNQTHVVPGLDWRSQAHMIDRHRQGMARYKESAGEVEARLTQSRHMFSPQERIDTPPWFAKDSEGNQIPGTMDVPLDKQIYVPPKTPIDPDLPLEHQQDIRRANWEARAPYRKYKSNLLSPPPTPAQVASTGAIAAGLAVVDPVDRTEHAPEKQKEFEDRRSQMGEELRRKYGG